MYPASVSPDPISLYYLDYLAIHEQLCYAFTIGRKTTKRKRYSLVANPISGCTEQFSVERTEKREGHGDMLVRYQRLLCRLRGIIAVFRSKPYFTRRMTNT
jgi:hypothetical protein